MEIIKRQRELCSKQNYMQVLGLKIALSDTIAALFLTLQLPNKKISIATYKRFV